MAFTELQCTGECAVPVGIGTLTGATMAAGGVAVVAVLVLRAMGEWHTIREARDRKAAARPPKAARPGASNGSTENGKSTPNGGGSGNPPHDHSA